MAKLPRGRPTSYKPEYCQMLIDHMKQGQSLFSFSAVINVNQDSLYEWEKRHPSFSEAIKAGRAQQANFWEKTGIKATHGKIPGFNATAFIWMTKNMLGWRDKQEITVHAEDWPKGGLVHDDSDPLTKG